MRNFLYFSVLIMITVHPVIDTCVCQVNQKHALVIGITGYPNYPKEKKIEYADDDAFLFFKFLLSREGGLFEINNIRLILNEQATRTRILKEIEWLSQQIKNDDLVYIYFSGHGEVDRNDYAYLMSYLADPNMPNDQGFRVDEFLNMIDQSIEAKHLIFFIDACHAGSAFSNGISAKGIEETHHGENKNIIDKFTNFWKQIYDKMQDTRLAFLSTSANEYSYEHKDLDGGHGLFTYFLIKGLQGEADGYLNASEKNYRINASEIFGYLYVKVSEYAKNCLPDSLNQHPTHSPIFNADYVLSLLDPPSKYSNLGVRIGGNPEEKLKEFVDKVEKNITLILKCMNQGNVVTEELRSICTPIGYEQIKNIITKLNPKPTELFVEVRLLKTSDPNYFQVRDITLKTETENNTRLLPPICLSINYPSGKINDMYFEPPEKIVKMVQSEFIKMQEKLDASAENNIMKFLKKYMTSYYLEEIDYIEKVYSEEAIIIVGKEIKTEKSNTYIDTTVHYYIKTKKEYINSLKKVFEYDDFLDLEFNNIIIEKHHSGKYYGINLEQVWHAKHYSDKGYLFLFIENIGTENYILHVRAWQDDKLDQGPLIGIHSIKVWETENRF